jgi:negative regulator of genetic competence, sporulation and motility
MTPRQYNELNRQADVIADAKVIKQVNDLMNMNDMYYVGNLVDVDGNGWVTKTEAIAILKEFGMGDEGKGYGDESPDEYKRMMAQVGIKL